MVDSAGAAIYEVWIRKLPAAAFGASLGARDRPVVVMLKTLEADPKPDVRWRHHSEAAVKELTKDQGADMGHWRWGALHRVDFPHPLNVAKYHLGPVERPGDGNTVNATGGTGYMQTAGLPYREIMDTSDWDRSMATNTPGESGDPTSPHYSDLLNDWAQGKYHPLPYTRAAVEAATVERINLVPQKETAKR